jgi:hypothetical protein
VSYSASGVFGTDRADDDRCKMQDNLEFLQWMKKYWDTHSRGEGYDAVGRA